MLNKTKEAKMMVAVAENVSYQTLKKISDFSIF